jgi:hypothetical protein
LETADVLIQAGHEGLTSGATGAGGPLGDEIDWTPIVANEAARILRSAGVSVIRGDANFDLPSRTYSVKAAVFLHFDGSANECTTTASVGYPTDPALSSHLTEDAEIAAEWKTFYKEFWPFGFMNDNFTSGLNRYYGFRSVTASKGMLLIEFGEVSCLEQAQWLKPRLKFLGELVAHFLSKRIGKGNVPLPGQREDVIKIEKPKPGEKVRTGTAIELSGDASTEVSTIEVLIGPGGPFKLGSVSPTGGKWSLSRTLVSPGKNRPLIFKALGSSGEVLQEIQSKLTVEIVSSPTTPELATLDPWRLFYAGLELNGSKIPRQGLDNPTLKSSLGILTEPLGELVQFGGFDFIKGKVSSFGGASDTGVSSTETGALTDENLKNLDDSDFYCAMRWSFSPNDKSFWADRRLLIINPINRKAIIVRAVDWGPNTSTGRTIDLSPKALSILGVDTDEEVICAFAKPNDAKIGSLT